VRNGFVAGQADTPLTLRAGRTIICDS